MVTERTVNAVDTIIAWVLVATFALLFIGLLTANIIGVCIYCKQIHTRCSDNHSNATAYEMKGNPCYEAVKVEQKSDKRENVLWDKADD